MQGEIGYLREDLLIADGVFSDSRERVKDVQEKEEEGLLLVLPKFPEGYENDVNYDALKGSVELDFSPGTLDDYGREEMLAGRVTRYEPAVGIGFL